MHLSEAASMYLDQLEQERYSPHTVKAYRLQLTTLSKDLDDMNVEEVTVQRLRKHLSNFEALKTSSIAHKIKSIRNLFRYLVREEYLSLDPSLKLRSPRLEEGVPKALTMDEIEELRESCETAMEHALLEFFFATGCRLSEVQTLDKDAIDWNRKSVVVKGKGSKEREVYFGSKASLWIRKYLEYRTDSESALFVTRNNPHRISTHHIQHMFKSIAARCGLEHKVSPHKLRHTLASQLVNSGAPIAVIQSLLGHKDSKTTLVYAKLTGVTRQQAYNRYFVQ